MKKSRRVVLLVAFLGVAICIVLLLNITAPNPTSRRYSSEVPLVGREANSQQIGADGERILSNDLHLPNNNEADQRQCICGNTSRPKSNSCNVCLVQIPSISTYRVPDFVGETFFAESKNKENLFYTGREVDQINDYVIAAHLLQRQLWVYVRVNTDVDPEFTRLVQSTGGDVVYYFTMANYADPVDSTAQRGLLLSGAMVAGMGWLEWRFLRRRIRVVVVDIPAGKPTPTRPVNKISRKLDHAEDFADKSKDRLRGQLHDEDVWGDEA